MFRKFLKIVNVYTLNFFRNSDVICTLVLSVCIDLFSYNPCCINVRNSDTKDGLTAHIIESENILNGSFGFC